LLGWLDGVIDSEGESLGASDGTELRLGILLGLELGKADMDGLLLASSVGAMLGRRLGLMLGWVEIEGATLGVTDGIALKVGVSLGCEVGPMDNDGIVLGV
jgi:hypothetical protein